MPEASSSPYDVCRDLQNLISVTLDNIILPLRKELKHCNQYYEILTLEVQDAENKTFEYLAQQISEICNADEDMANTILKEYPKSESCFKCLGIDDDTSQGLLLIRGIGFLQLMDMSDDEITTILQNYGDSSDEIEHVLAGLAKIHSNVDLIESDLAFEDDTRNLIKLVIKLTSDDPSTEFSASSGVSQADSTYDHKAPPLYVSRPESGSRFDDLQTHKLFSAPDVSSVAADLPSEMGIGLYASAGEGVRENVSVSSPQNPVDSVDLLATSSCQRLTCACCSSPLLQPSVVYAPYQNNPGSVRSQGGSRLNSTAGFCTFHRLNSPTVSSFPWDGEAQLLNGGLSVPTTPVWSGKPTCGVTISPTSSSQSGRTTITTDETPPSSPHDRQVNQNNASCHFRDREHHTRLPGTPPPKHRLKHIFPLHRSKSHESNLANRIIPLTNAGMSVSPHLRNSVSRPSLNGPNAVSPDALSVVNGEAFIYNEPNTYSPTSSLAKGSSHSRITLSPNIKSVSHPTYTGGSSLEAVVGARWMNNSPSPRILDSIRQNCDARSTRVNVQPPTLMTTSADGENSLSVLSVPANGITFVLGCNGMMHKVKVHKSCVSQSYRLPCVGAAHSSEMYEPKGSPNAHHKTQVNALFACQSGLRPAHSTPAFQGSESNSASSCTSSAPGSPFGPGAGSLLNTHLTSHSLVNNATGNGNVGLINSPPYTNPANSVSLLSSPASLHGCTTAAVGLSLGGGQAYSPHHMTRCCNQFEFPSANQKVSDGTHPMDSGENNALVSTHSSAESERTVVDGVVRRLESMDSQDDASGLTRVNSISVTLKEWDIPMNSLVIGEVIGQGTFGTVYRAKWHGEVAVKRIDIDPDDPDGPARLEAFKREVALLHKTRHENLVLFMGACMKAPNFAIVTQMSQGETLYHQIHCRESAMAINRTINIASQIAKGMGYLHAKGIVHRDLKTRNIFVEANSRVVIGDFGVFNFVRLYKKAKWGNYLNVPPFWLSYLAPEVIQALRLDRPTVSRGDELPLTARSDVYAFGTVWYELLTNEFPFKGLPAEAIVYLSGRGIKQNLRIPGPKDFKEILTQCWSYSPTRRPEFTTLVKSLDRLPKLHRSPSYPAKPTSGLNSVAHDSLLG
ncbi:unnamed protein product [Calicophoron daubneyi]|uniref:Protein kinase domain-containing protein n=1 Tax=Calicophoron daubneyi TaxID=300641 RepID=A0AAV2T178_CALDB